jgi:hypothetical protein
MAKAKRKKPTRRPARSRKVAALKSKRRLAAARTKAKAKTKTKTPARKPKRARKVAKRKSISPFPRNRYLRAAGGKDDEPY